MRIITPKQAIQILEDGNSTIGPMDVRKFDLEHGSFGSVAHYECEHCGPVWEEPENVCLSRGSMWEPPDYADRCPYCGRIECIGENDGTHSFAVRKRRTYVLKNNKLVSAKPRERTQETQLER